MKKYRENEDNNYHSENLLLLAKAVGSKNDIEMANTVLKALKKAGYAEPEFTKKRNALNKKLWPMFKKEVAKEEKENKKTSADVVKESMDRLFNNNYTIGNIGIINESAEDEEEITGSDNKNEEEKFWYTSSDGTIEFQMTLAQAESVSQPGKDAEEEDVRQLMRDPDMKEVVDYLFDNMDNVKEVLKEYGAWDDEELEDEDMNIVRMIWLAGNDISENHFVDSHDDSELEENVNEEDMMNEDNFKLNEKKLANIEILLDSNRGIYIPRDFVNGFDMKYWGISEYLAQECSDPDNENYWDAWNDILDKAKYKAEDGRVFNLYQDGDLYAICWNALTDEEKENLGINENKIWIGRTFRRFR